MKLYSFILVAATWILFSQISSAIVDSNNNGLSDLWEKHYNSGNLFPSNFDPQADPDGDGWTHEQEAAAGTDPLGTNPPNGYLQPVIDHIPAVMEEDEGVPVIVTPEAVTVTWQTLLGKNYTLLFSPDLQEESWIQVGSAFVGNGSEVTYGFVVSGGDNRFWRVAVNDVDTDGDLLTDYEERTIGSSPYFSDTDGDGIDDFTAYNLGFNPAGEDSDGDGTPDSALYSVEFEVTEESLITDSVGHEALTGTDNLHRYLTHTSSHEYSISGSPTCSDIEGGKWSEINSYVKNGIPQGYLSIHHEGITPSDAYATHQLPSLPSNERLEFDSSQTSVSVPPITATEEMSTTTTSTSWKVRRNVPGQPDTILRSGTEIKTNTYRKKLTDTVTPQELWTNYFKDIPWTSNHVNTPVLHGPGSGSLQAAPGLGKVVIAEMIRDYFRNSDFQVAGNVSYPHLGRIAYSPTNIQHHVWDVRLKSLRWRWVRFNPLAPFDYEYATPPTSYQKTFYFLVHQKDTTSLSPGLIPTTQETIPKGIIQIECKGSEGTGWHVVPPSKFESYRVEEPADLATLDFTKSGESQVLFGNLPVGVRGYVHKEISETVGIVKGNYVSEKSREKIADPTDHTGFKTESKSELKIAQWSKVFDSVGGNWQFNHNNFKYDMDVFRIRLPKIPPPPGTAEHRVKIWTTDEAGQQLDPGAEVDLNVHADFHESAALCLVAKDAVDDNFAVEGKVDGQLGDRTYRAVLGGKVKFQWLTAPGDGEKPVFEIPVHVKKTVTAKGFVLEESTTSATAYFERAKQALSACGVKLDYSVVSISPSPPGVDFGFIKEFELPDFVGDTEITMTAEPKALMDAASCKPPAGVIPVYFLRNFDEGFAGWSNAPSLMATADAAYGGAIFLDCNKVSESTLAHEFLHILLDASHGEVDPLWYQEHNNWSWCLWNGAASPIENGITARRRILDGMRSRMLKSPYCK